MNKKLQTLPGAESLFRAACVNVSPTRPGNQRPIAGSSARSDNGRVAMPPVLLINSQYIRQAKPKTHGNLTERVAFFNRVTCYDLCHN